MGTQIPGKVNQLGGNALFFVVMLNQPASTVVMMEACWTRDLGNSRDLRKRVSKNETRHLWPAIGGSRR